MLNNRGAFSFSEVVVVYIRKSDAELSLAKKAGRGIPARGSERRGGCWSERRLVTAVCQVTAGHGRGFAAGRKRGAGFAQPAVERPGARVVVAS